MSFNGGGEMRGIQKAALLLLAGAAGCQPAVSIPPAPAAPVSVADVLSMEALAGQTVMVAGRCVDRGGPKLAEGSRPQSGQVWQLEDNGVATWVVGKMPEACDRGTTAITALVARDTLPRLGPPRLARQYLVVR
jgi:hypothetical protein